jgi:hypothetical protein
MRINLIGCDVYYINWLIAAHRGCNVQMFLDDYDNFDTVAMIPPFHYCEYWSQGGPLLAQYTIEVTRGIDGFVATTNKYWWSPEDGGTDRRAEYDIEGWSYLETAMRVLALALNDGIIHADVPDELVGFWERKYGATGDRPTA